MSQPHSLQLMRFTYSGVFLSHMHAHTHQVRFRRHALLYGGLRPSVCRVSQTALNHCDGYTDLHRIVFKEVRDPEIRTDILQHFAVQARYRVLPQPLRIVSDLDDTIKPMTDFRFPHGHTYPGVRAVSRLCR